MANTLLMPKATAVWLVDNTSLSFDQIAQFCALHPLEVKAIADGEAAQGIKGMDPVITGQLSRDEIAKAEADPAHRLKLQEPKVRVPESKRKAPRYTPLSKRQDRPNAILWLVRNHPELKDARFPGSLAPPSRRSSRSATASTGTPRTCPDGPGDARSVLADRPRLRGAARLAWPRAACAGRRYAAAGRPHRASAGRGGQAARRGRGTRRRRRLRQAVVAEVEHTGRIIGRRVAQTVLPRTG